MSVKLVVVILVGACSFRPGALGGAPDDDAGITDDAPPDAPTSDIVWRIDTDAEFRMAVGRNAISLQRDGIEPVAWTYGALRAAGANTELFTDSASPTLWDDVLAVVPAASVSGRGLAVLPTIDQRRPGGVGITADDSWTMWAEGDIFLEAGDHAFQLTGDDDAIFEVAGTNNVYTRVVSSSNFPTTNSNTLAVATTGWYPVRMALSQGSGGATFHLTDDAPGAGGRVPIERWRYRARVNDLRGFFQIGADNQFLIGTTGSDLDESNLVNINFGAGIPGDLAITDGESLSVRWAGQVWIDTPGDYVFHINSDGGHLFRLDGVIVLDRYAGGVVSGSTAAITLAKGWHEIQLDFNEAVGTGYIDLTIESGPALVGQQLPLANLRPVTGRGDRVATATRIIDTRLEPQRDLDTSIQFVVTGAPGANARRVDAGFIVNHGAWNEVEVALVPPAGTSVLLYDNAAGTGTQTIVREGIQPIGTWPVDGVWTMTFNDTNSSNSGTALAAFLTIHYQGGMPSIALMSSWTSEVRDLGYTASVASVSWDGVFPTGTSTAVQVRMCEQPDCADGAFVPVPTSGGTTNATGRYAQLRVVFTSDGDASPWLDWIDFVAR